MEHLFMWVQPSQPPSVRVFSLILTPTLSEPVVTISIYLSMFDRDLICRGTRGGIRLRRAEKRLRNTRGYSRSAPWYKTKASSLAGPLGSGGEGTGPSAGRQGTGRHSPWKSHGALCKVIR